MAELTREQVLAMTAGPELDALVYRRIFGRPLLDAPGGAIGKRSWVKDGDGRTGPLPRYSTDIAAAWEVRAKMFALTFSKRMRFLSALQYAVTHRLHMGGAIHPGDVPLFMEAEDICRAALLLTLTEAK